MRSGFTLHTLQRQVTQRSNYHQVVTKNTALLDPLPYSHRLLAWDNVTYCVKQIWGKFIVKKTKKKQQQQQTNK